MLLIRYLYQWIPEFDKSCLSVPEDCLAEETHNLIFNATPEVKGLEGKKANKCKLK
jgi:hypothetical protein